MVWNVITSRELHDAAHEVLDDFAEVTVANEYEDKAALDADIGRFDAAISMPMSRDRILQATNMKMVTSRGIGLDTVDIEAATEAGVLICNNPGANTRAVAEQSIAFVLSVRKSLLQADKDVRSGHWEKYGYLAPELEDDTLGVFGCGAIGSLVTKLARGLGMKTIAYDPYKDADDLPAGVEKISDISSLFERSDVVCIHAPLTEETQEAVGAAELEALGLDGTLVNCARGEIVDEDALIEALESGTIHGAGLDVFHEEPLPADHPLTDIENPILTPHSAGSTLKSVPAKHRGAAKNVRMVYEGRVPQSTVNLNEVALKTAFGQGSPTNLDPDSF